jgi:hypothetical protein
VGTGDGARDRGGGVTVEPPNVEREPAGAVSDTWHAIDLPVLRAIVLVEAETDPGRPISETAVLERSGLNVDRDEWVRSLRRLVSGDYIGAKITITRQKWKYLVQIWGATGEARRVTGQWPTGDDAYFALLETLDEAIEEAPAEDKGRLKKLREAAAATGKDVVAEVLSRVIERRMGMS